MYKKATRLKLRFNSKYGPLTAEQLWDLKMTDLKNITKASYAEVEALGQTKEDLAFLEGVETSKEAKEVEEIKLRFQILKDVYMTRQNEAKESAENARTDMQIKHLEAILAEKQEAELRNLSTEELLKKIEELKNK